MENLLRVMRNFNQLCDYIPNTTPKLQIPMLKAV